LLPDSKVLFWCIIHWDGIGVVADWVAGGWCVSMGGDLLTLVCCGICDSFVSHADWDRVGSSLGGVSREAYARESELLSGVALLMGGISVDRLWVSFRVLGFL
jgi:hypothetical protein